MRLSGPKDSDMTARGEFINRSSNVYTGGKRKVSQALWCDKSDHAFSSKDPERQHFAQTQTVPVATGNSYGTPTYQDRMQVTEEIDICGPCWKSGGVMAEKAIPASPTLDDMQQYNDDWQAGYNAAIDHLTTERSHP